MSLLNRKRLRRLRFWLYGKPQLVIPAPIVGGHRFNRPRQDGNVARDDEFLFGDPSSRLTGMRLSAPSDAEWGEQYKALKDGHITYDAERARTRLLSLLTDDRSRPITRFTVDDTQKLGVIQFQTQTKDKA